MDDLRDLEEDRHYLDCGLRLNEQEVWEIADDALNEIARLKWLLVSEWRGGGFVVTAVHFREPPIGGTECCVSNGRIYWWFEDDKTAWAAVRKEANENRTRD